MVLRISHCQSLIAFAVLITIYTEAQSVPIIDVNIAMAGLEHQASLSWSILSPNSRTAPTRIARTCTWQV